MPNVWIVTCSRNAEDAGEMLRSFASTIESEENGVGCIAREIVAPSSIAEGYNEALRQINESSLSDLRDLIIFTHSDVRCMFSRWAWKNALSNVNWANVGFVGVAGAVRLNDTGIWWNNNITDLRGGILHNTTSHGTYYTHFGPGITGCPAVAVDGVFLMTTLQALEDFSFWSAGFHFYDIDACLQMHMKRNRTNYVASLPLLHYSIGQTGKEWELGRQKFMERWGKREFSLEVRA